MSHLHTISLISRAQELLTHPMIANVFGNPIFQLASPFEWNAIACAQRVAQADMKWMDMSDHERTEEAVAKRDDAFKRLATWRELNRVTSHNGGETPMIAIRRVCIPRDKLVTDERLKAQTRAQIIDERMAGRLAKDAMALRYVAILKEKQALRDAEARDAEQICEDVFLLMNATDVELSGDRVFTDKDIADFGDVEQQLEAMLDKVSDAVIWAWRRLDLVQSHRDGVIATRDELRKHTEVLAKDLGVNLLRVNAQAKSFADEVAAIEATMQSAVNDISADLDAQLAEPVAPAPKQKMKRVPKLAAAA